MYIREFLISGEPIYKIGSTKNIFTRIKSYPKGSVLICCCYCENINITETNIKKIFKIIFNQKLSIGTEYFEGDVHKMTSSLLTTTQNDFNHDVRAIEKVEDIKKNMKKNNNAAIIIQKNYKFYLQKKQRKVVEVAYGNNIKSFMDNEIYDYDNEFLNIETVKNLWNSRYKNFQLNDFEFIKLSHSYVSERIIIKDGKVGWLNKRMGNKDVFIKFLNALRSFVDNEVKTYNGSFLIFNNIKNLWSARYDKLIKDKDFTVIIQKLLGPLELHNDKLGWFDKMYIKKETFNDKVDISSSIIKDPYKEFRDEYLLRDDDSHVQWKDLRPAFYKWQSNNNMSTNHKASDIKQYFAIHLGGYVDTTRNYVRVKGFLGWSIISTADI